MANEDFKLEECRAHLVGHRHKDEQEKEEEEASLSSSLRIFRSAISNSLNRLFSDTRPTSNTLRFAWIQGSLSLIHTINDAFAELVRDLDYPVTRWESTVVDEYMSYTLSLLDRLNSYTASLSHLGQARISLLHALHLVADSPSHALERLKPIESVEVSIRESKEEGNKQENVRDAYFDKTRVVSQALSEAESVVFWLCGVALSGLTENHHGLQIKIPDPGFVDSLLMNLGLPNFDAKVEIREIGELNNAVSRLKDALVNGRQSDEEADELQRQLEELDRTTEALSKEVDQLFSETLAARTRVLDNYRVK